MTGMLVNGEPVSVVTAQDRAVQYGDGLFETIALRNGKLELWAQHMERMQQGCRRLGLPVIDEQIWRQDIARLHPGNHAVIKLLLSRGASGRGYRYADPVTPTRMVSLHDWPDYSGCWMGQGVRVGLCATPVSVNRALAGIKHLNRLDNVLARNEWQDINIAEGLMADDVGNVVEGTMSNLFAVKNNILMTPVLNRAGVSGVMRHLVLDMARQQQLAISECDIRIADLFEMDELFLTNSVIGIWPVIQLDKKQFQAGRITQLLKQTLLSEMAKHVSPV